jgi:predicted RNA-binding Zn-ribbon protein involved in translation (DUF1610 family)
MSWIEDLEYDNQYECAACGEVTLHRNAAKEPTPETIDCGGCGTPGARYTGFVPQKMGGGFVMQFEKNGRIGYAIRNGDKTTYISKTKAEYLKTGVNKSHLSREYERHTQDKMENEFGKFRKELKTNATVTSAKGSDDGI